MYGSTSSRYGLRVVGTTFKVSGGGMLDRALKCAKLYKGRRAILRPPPSRSTGSSYGWHRKSYVTKAFLYSRAMMTISSGYFTRGYMNFGHEGQAPNFAKRRADSATHLPAPSRRSLCRGPRAKNLPMIPAFGR